MSRAKNAFEIFQLLEKSNCGNCGAKTCLAFAGAAFKGQRRLSECVLLDPAAATRISEDSGTKNAPEAEGVAHFDRLKKAAARAIPCSASAARSL